MKMHYGEIKYFDIANGPGIRVSLFVSGCPHACKGCFNEAAWNPSFGELFTEEVEERILQALDKKETATFFIGRKTCPYCRKFAGTLAGVVAETKAHIYFINSEEPSQLDALQDFRSRYEIPTVPGFVHVENGEIKVRCDSSMSAQEIKEFAGL